FEPGRVHAAAVGDRTVAVVRTGEGLYALEGRCPHQGGPLVDGTLCDGALRCPWHGYDFALATGRGVGNDLAAEVLKIREQDGAVEILAPKPRRSTWTVSHVIVETIVNWGVDTVFGMVGHSNLGLAEAIRVQEERGRIRYPGSRHAELASLALKTAVVDRDVAHLIFPDEVQTLDPGDEGPSGPAGRVSSTAIAPDPAAVDEAMWRLARAKRPVIIVGYGARS